MFSCHNCCVAATGGWASRFRPSTTAPSAATTVGDAFILLDGSIELLADPGAYRVTMEVADAVR